MIKTSTCLIFEKANEYGMCWVSETGLTRVFRLPQQQATENINELVRETLWVRLACCCWGQLRQTEKVSNFSHSGWIWNVLTVFFWELEGAVDSNWCCCVRTTTVSVDRGGQVARTFVLQKHTKIKMSKFGKNCWNFKFGMRFTVQSCALNVVRILYFCGLCGK